ncbi:MAG: DNA translocase FtsK, partial [Firmicutes bacterium]|nr:DNA translocase FtsK [Bacillota bacterium]
RQRSTRSAAPVAPAASAAPAAMTEHSAPGSSAVGAAAVRAATPSAPTAQMPDTPLKQLKLIDDSTTGILPPLSILRVPMRRRVARKESEDPNALGRMLEETLASFGVDATVVGVSQGPMVTRFEVQPGVGVKVSKIVNLADDLALAFASAGVRIEAPIPGKSAVGIEVPSREKSIVYLREVLDSDEFRGSESRLTMALGKDIAGAPIVADLADMLHLLVAGATGSGKSVCLNSIICSLLFKATPEEVRLLMIDPKRVELSVYDGIPHLLAPVITDPKKASGYLRWVVEEMENRYRLFQIAGARNIAQYNDMVKSGALEQFLPDQDTEADAQQTQGQAEAERPRPLSYVVVIVDELADLMMVAQREVEDAIARLAFMARAAGIHLLIATQRPSVDILTGIIKANIPSRIAFAVSSQVDSRIILDTAGAERLLGKGDMLFHPVGLPKPIRVQGAYISDEEVAALVEFVRRGGEPLYEAENVESSAKAGEGIAEDDELFAEAATLVVQTGEASISKIQRRFRVGYARAARLIDTMEVLGIIGPYEGSKPRKVLMDEAELEEALGRRG